MAVYLDLDVLLAGFELFQVSYFLKSLQNKVHEISEIGKNLRVLGIGQLGEAVLNVQGKS